MHAFWTASRCAGELRASGSGVPIVLLTSGDSEIDEALGLEGFGADDYVSKPFSTRISSWRASRR